MARASVKPDAFPMDAAQLTLRVEQIFRLIQELSEPQRFLCGAWADSLAEQRQNRRESAAFLYLRARELTESAKIAQRMANQILDEQGFGGELHRADVAFIKRKERR